MYDLFDEWYLEVYINGVYRYKKYPDNRLQSPYALMLQEMNKETIKYACYERCN